ncbi:GNAT family N-acetyltransferase [Thiolapillus sp.]
MFRLIVDAEINLVFPEDALAPILFDLIDSNREYLGEWFPWIPDTRSVADMSRFIKSSISGFADGKQFVCGIEYQGNIVGVVSYYKIDRELKKANMGYWLAESAQGKGVMTRCCKYLLHYAFDRLDMEKVEIIAASVNQRSRKLCERLGMTLEGVITNAEKLPQGIVDHAVYGLHKPVPEDS